MNVAIYQKIKKEWVPYPYNTMTDYQQRVIDEKRELDLKLSKLVDFLSSKIFKDLPKEDKKLLKSQTAEMKKYSEILDKRIALFTSVNVDNANNSTPDPKK